MKSSKAGSILLLISSILSFLVALGLIALAIAIPYLPDTEGEPIAGIVIVLMLATYILISGIFKLWASRLMLIPKTTAKGGIIAIIVGSLSFVDILAIVGGILALYQSDS